MKERNVFEEFRQELESKFTKEREDKLKSNIQGTVGSLSFIAEIVELFVTKFFTVLVGKGADKTTKIKN